MPLSSPGGLLLPSRLGSGVWQCGALLVSPFTVEWRCYVQAGVVEMSKFYVFLVVFLARCSPRSLQDFTLGSMLSASSSSHHLGILHQNWFLREKNSKIPQWFVAFPSSMITPKILSFFRILLLFYFILMFFLLSM
jgi:hypothetical protein